MQSLRFFVRSAEVIEQFAKGDLALADRVPDVSAVFIPTDRLHQVATKVMEAGNCLGGQAEAIDGIEAPPARALSLREIQAAVATFFSKLQVVMAVPAPGRRPCPCVNGSALRVLCLQEHRALVHKQYLEEVQAQIARNIIHGRRSSLIQSPQRRLMAQ